MGEFRGKRQCDGRWFYGSLTRGPNGRRFILQDPNNFRLSPGIEVDPETVGEFTTRTSPSGKKFFEGDRCTSHNNSEAFAWTVIWDDEETRFAFSRIGMGVETRCKMNQDWIEEFKAEPVGTIHDHPHALAQCGAEWAMCNFCDLPAGTPIKLRPANPDERPCKYAPDK